MSRTTSSARSRGAVTATSTTAEDVNALDRFEPPHDAGPGVLHAHRHGNEFSEACRRGVAGIVQASRQTRALIRLIGEVSTVRELASSVIAPYRQNRGVSDYRLSEDPTDLDIDRIVSWISTDAYWAKGRTSEVIERSFANSFPVGLYAAGGMQVAVARIVSDRATFVWLCDVYVDPDHRGRGLGTMLADWAVTWAERHDIKRIILATLDAHGVYAKAGFTPIGHPERWMEIDRRPPFG